MIILGQGLVIALAFDPFFCLVKSSCLPSCRALCRIWTLWFKISQNVSLSILNERNSRSVFLNFRWTKNATFYILTIFNSVTWQILFIWRFYLMLAILFNLTIFDGLGLFWFGDFFEFLTNLMFLVKSLSQFPDFRIFVIWKFLRF